MTCDIERERERERKRIGKWIVYVWVGDECLDCHALTYLCLNA